MTIYCIEYHDYGETETIALYGDPTLADKHLADLKKYPPPYRTGKYSIVTHRISTMCDYRTGVYFKMEYDGTTFKSRYYPFCEMLTELERHITTVDASDRNTILISRVFVLDTPEEFEFEKVRNYYEEFLPILYDKSVELRKVMSILDQHNNELHDLADELGDHYLHPRLLPETTEAKSTILFQCSLPGFERKEYPNANKKHF